MHQIAVAAARSVLFLSVTGALSSCGGGDHVSDVVWTLTYEQPSIQTGGSDAFCNHHYAPENLSVTTDQGEVAFLSGQGRRRTAILTNVAAGAHWLFVIDISYCADRPACPTAVSGVSLNGMPLSREVPVDGSSSSCVALRFNVSAAGSVSP